jgi:hypothetical protein
VETVRVPAGDYRAIPVDVSAGAGRTDEPYRYWVAPGVGAVKWVTADGDEVVLKAFSPGRD